MLQLIFLYDNKLYVIIIHFYSFFSMYVFGSSLVMSSYTDIVLETRLQTVYNIQPNQTTQHTIYTFFNTARAVLLQGSEKCLVGEM